MGSTSLERLPDSFTQGTLKDSFQPNSRGGTLFAKTSTGVVDTVLPNVLKAGLLAVVNLAAVVGFSKATVVRGFSVSTWILAGLSVC